MIDFGACGAAIIAAENGASKEMRRRVELQTDTLAKLKRLVDDKVVQDRKCKRVKLDVINEELFSRIKSDGVTPDNKNGTTAWRTFFNELESYGRNKGLYFWAEWEYIGRGRGKISCWVSRLKEDAHLSWREDYKLRRKRELKAYEKSEDEAFARMDTKPWGQSGDNRPCTTRSDTCYCSYCSSFF